MMQRFEVNSASSFMQTPQNDGNVFLTPGRWDSFPPTRFLGFSSTYLVDGIYFLF